MKLLLQWAVTSSALILIVLTVRQLFRNRLSARVKYALWGVVLLRLLFPFQVELPADTSAALPLLASNLAPELPSVLDRPLSPATAGGYAQIDPENVEASGFHIRDNGSVASDHPNVYPVADPETGDVRAYSGGFTLEDALTALWLAGAGAMGAAVLLSNLHFALRLRKRRERLEDVEAPIPVYTAANLPSPCLFGVLRPAVYVTPRAAEDPDALRHVLAHELTHYKHGDHLWSLLRILALALHWYNPLVWLAVGLSRQDGELACDEGAVERLGEAERIPYGRTLVDMVAARSLRPGDLLSCSTAMTGKSVKRRVALLVKKPETVRTALFAVIALVALGLVFVFAGRGERGRQRDYADFNRDVKTAQSIYLSQHALSGDDLLPDITDPELLEQAKDILVQGAGDWLNPPSVLENLDLSSLRTLALTGQDGQEVRYQLVRFDPEPSPILNSQFCVLTEGSLSSIPGSRAVALLDQETVSKIYELMLSSLPLSDVERVFLQAEEATSIRYCPPSYSNYFYREAITDPRLLASVREYLTSNLVSLEPWYSTPDGEAMIHASRLVLTTAWEEVTYSLIPWNGYTYVARGSGDYSVQEHGRTAYLRTRGQTNLASAIAGLARTQELLSQDPSFPVPMARAELGQYSLSDICRSLGYQLRGWSGAPEDAELARGYSTPDRVQLWYNGDENHLGHWVLELLQPTLSSHSSGFTVLADRPSAVFAADLYRTGQQDYAVMPLDLFAACLRPGDVVSVTAGDYEPGQAVTLDVPALKELLTQSLYRQFSDDYDPEKHGQYVLTVQVKGSGMESYLGHELAEDSDRLTLSAGSEKDVVCLSHRGFSATPEPVRLFVRSPELYRTVRNLFD